MVLVEGFSEAITTKNLSAPTSKFPQILVMWRDLKNFQSQRHKQQPWHYKAASYYIIKSVQITALIKRSQASRGREGLVKMKAI